MSAQERLTRRLLELIAARLHVVLDEADQDRLFIDFGIASADAVALTVELGELTGAELPATILYDHPTPRALARHLTQGLSERTASGDHAPDLALRDPVAIVGIGCRLPGANGPAEFWSLLEEGKDAIGVVPASRRAEGDGWDEPGVGVGGFLREVEQFDPGFFSVSGREAAAMDPQQRLLLEVSHEALQDAGARVGDLGASSTGVYVGISSNDFLLRELTPEAAPDGYVPTGVAHSVAANRISYAFDLHGPSLAVDTACSSSLVAVHQAVSALRLGECDTALAGGVNVILSPVVGRCFRVAGVLSVDGRCKSFALGADGLGRAEGVVMIVLKRLRDARSAGDRIYAVIRGGAVNSDGRTNGLMSPSAPAQARLLRAACARAGVRPEEIDYVEAHGSGTALGDQMELRALAEVLGRPARPLPIGSVKSNLGHLEAAAGAAGLIKVALALHHGRLPVSLHADEPADDFDWAAAGLAVQRESVPWHGRLAGVSSFGFGGTNAHLILEAAPPGPVPGKRPDRLYLPLSAHTPVALRELAEAWADALGEPDFDAVGACATAAGRRDHYAHRLAVTGRDASELRLALEHARTKLATMPPRPARPGKVAFLFSDESWCGRPLDLAAAIQAAGVQPAFVVGHGAGEVAAALHAGVLTAADAERVVKERERLLDALPKSYAMRVRLERRVAEALCVRMGGDLAVASADATQATTILGPRERLEGLRAALGERVLADEPIPAGPDHSALCGPYGEDLARSLSGLIARAARTPLVSTVTGGPLDGGDMGAGHWARHLTSPSLLGQALGHAVRAGTDTFVEFGTDGLGRWLRAAADGRQVASVGCAGWDDLPAALLRLYELGQDPDWAALNAPTQVVTIPLLPWSRTWTQQAEEVSA